MDYVIEISPGTQSLRKHMDKMHKGKEIQMHKVQKSVHYLPRKEKL